MEQPRVSYATYDLVGNWTRHSPIAESDKTAVNCYVAVDNNNNTINLTGVLS